FISIACGCAGQAEAPEPTPTSPPPVPTFPPTPTKTSTLLPSPSPTSLPTLPPNTATPSPSPTPTPAVLIGAGDIAVCGDAPELQGDEKTAALIENQIRQYPGAVVFTAGDTAYGEGSPAQLRNCFGPTWGRFKDRIRPAAGNHDYMTGSGSPYFEYFGAAAGETAQGYYSYDLGDWHIVVLNSNCNDIACGPDSKQVKWLRDDLQNSGKACILAYWHHPRWSSGLAGGRFAATFWRTAAELGVDVVVNGDDHDYERFAPMDAEGNADPNGVREFVVGTGGAPLRQWGEIRPNSEVRYNGAHGVIQFKLSPGHYEWEFIPAEDTALTDTGSGACR
ncbi:MAG: alkaline phosphatase, partial [Chloroflexi bacterium]